MAKDREQAAADAEARRNARVLAIAEEMVPAKHLAIFAKVKLTYEDIGPSEVWRILAGNLKYRYDPKSSMFFLSNTDNKEA